jgi:hypothetical protein
MAQRGLSASLSEVNLRVSKILPRLVFDDR